FAGSLVRIVARKAAQKSGQNEIDDLPAAVRQQLIDHQRAFMQLVDRDRGLARVEKRLALSQCDCCNAIRTAHSDGLCVVAVRPSALQHDTPPNKDTRHATLCAPSRIQHSTQLKLLRSRSRRKFL